MFKLLNELLLVIALFLPDLACTANEAPYIRPPIPRLVTYLTRVLPILDGRVKI